MTRKGAGGDLAVKRQRQRCKRISIFFFIFILIILILAQGLLTPGPVNAWKETAAGAPAYARVTIAAAGDVMVHSPQFKAQYQRETGLYDFTNNFRFVKPYLLQVDLALANLETTFGGEALGYSGFPRFNTPDSLADALKDAGFDLIVTANNHTLDTGMSGVFRTIDVLRERGLEVIGTRKPEDEKSYIVKKSNGIKIGFSAYTFETPRVSGKKTINGIAVPPKYTDLIDSFSYQNLTDELLKMKKRIDAMREEGAEFIVFYLHWGEEYQREPNGTQRKIATALVNYGVDLIFGSHPHVLQPVEYVRSEDGTKGALVFFSLGNFLSNQRYELLKKKYTEDGVIAYVEVKKDLRTDEVFIAGLSYLPTWVHKYTEKQRLVYEILPLNDTMFNFEYYNLLAKESIRRAVNSKRNTVNLLKKPPLPVARQPQAPPADAGHSGMEDSGIEYSGVDHSGEEH
jgi:poly-gamma-glutamate capsule biosynthesis protein CapA/YwtB (metallophosphatase superfamily)